MSKFIKTLWVSFVSSVVISGCQSEIKIPEQDCVVLIKSITQMPMKRGIEIEGEFYAVFERSDEKAIADCLLSQITNTDPVDLMTMSSGPKPQFVVGDISVFMLTRMYDIPFTTFLSEKDWKHMGIFEYYKFIQQDGAYEDIQATLTPLIEQRFE